MSRVLHRLEPAVRRAEVQRWLGQQVAVEVELVRGGDVDLWHGELHAVARLLNGLGDVLVLVTDDGEFATSLATVRTILPLVGGDR